MAARRPRRAGAAPPRRRVGAAHDGRAAACDSDVTARSTATSWSTFAGAISDGSASRSGISACVGRREELALGEQGDAAERTADGADDDDQRGDGCSNGLGSAVVAPWRRRPRATRPTRGGRRRAEGR